MDLNAVALGLAANVNAMPILADGTQLHAFDYCPDALPEPCFFVAEIDVDFDKTMRRGSDELTVTTRVMVSRADDKSGQLKLRSFMRGGGVTSVKKMIEADRTLGGACDDLRVTKARGNRLYNVGEARYYGVEFEVFIVGDGS